MKRKVYSSPLNAKKLKEIFEEIFDLMPVKEKILGFMNHSMDYHQLEQDIKGFFCSGKFNEKDSFLKKQLQDSAYELSMEGFKVFKGKILGFFDISNFQTFILL